ncbi:DNA-methyltransferase, partial [Rhizorhabdus histidinilytica]|uniref:DNA-methyltransferase n=1 Tax=Rhizorhabdus histidinilytica TaxID=439228 RepID=UPI00321FFE61
FCTEPSPATNNVLLGKNGRNRTNIWTYAGANQKGSSAGKVLADHPTPKPVELVADAFQDVTRRGDLVFDPFMGSGTTLIAAEATGRIACGIDLDPGYVDVTIARWQQMTGKQAVHQASGKTFEEVAQERSNEAPDVEAAE